MMEETWVPATILILVPSNYQSFIRHMIWAEGDGDGTRWEGSTGLEGPLP